MEVNLETLQAQQKAMEAVLSNSAKQAEIIADTGVKVGQALAKVAELAEGSERRFKTLEEWVQSQFRTLSARRVSLQGGDKVLDVIPESERRHVRLAEIHSAQVKAAATRLNVSPNARGAFLDDPPLKALVGLWMRNHLKKLSAPADFMAKYAEQQDKIVHALGFNAGEYQKVALQEDTAAEGGNLVPVILEAEILRLVVDNGAVRPFARKVPMTVKTHAYPTRAAAFSAALIAEEGTITDSVPASPFNQSNLTAKKFACFATVSGELLQDNVVALTDYLAMEFAEQIARLEDAQALEGDGTGINFTGVNSASGINTKTSGTNGERLLYNLLVGTKYAAGEGSSRRGGRYFMHPQAWAAIMSGRADAVAAGDAKGPMIAPIGVGTGQFQEMVVGSPCELTTAILRNRTVGTGTNRTQIYFGPPDTLILGDLLGFQIDLNPYGKFSTFQVDIRGLKRTGILVGVPSAWTRYTAIDPDLSMG